MLISGVLYDGYQTDDEDEAIQIINVGSLPVNLKNYTVTDGTSPGVRFPADAFLFAQSARLGRKGRAKFHDSFGFWPDFAQVITGAVSPLTGNWPGLANDHGDVQVKDAAGNVLDRLVYGTETLPFTGWSGPAVSPYSVGPRGIEGQVIARVPDERTGLPVPDTDTAADWMQYTGNYTTGRRAMFPAGTWTCSSGRSPRPRPPPSRWASRRTMPSTWCAMRSARRSTASRSKLTS